LRRIENIPQSVAKFKLNKKNRETGESSRLTEK
jgi:hypothetical protein